MFRARILCLCLLADVIACGPRYESHNPVEEPQGEESEADLSPQTHETVAASYDLTVEYDSVPVDMIIIKENTNQLQRNPFTGRIAAASAILSARIEYELPDANVLVIPAGIDPTINPQDPNHYFSSSSEPFREHLESALEANHAQVFPQRPLTVLRQLLNGEGELVNAAFFRPNSHLAIMFMHFSDETDEPYLPEDLTYILNETWGPGRWSVSALVPDGDGCIYDNNGNTTNAPEDVRRNLAIRMSNRSNGLFGSICERSYGLFFDRFVLEQTGSQFFPISLPELESGDSIEADSLRVTAGNTEIMDFRFHPDQNILELPTLIEPGSEVRVTYDLRREINSIISSKDHPDETPEVIDTALPPEVVAFLTDIDQPILQPQCGSCHGPDSGRQFKVGSYEIADRMRNSIRNRITLPASDPQIMPPAGPLTEQDLNPLLDWIDGG